MTLDPARAAIRRGVRRVLEADAPPPGTTVLVACSGGADSLALLSGTVFEAHRRDLRVGAVVVDHGLQPDSARVAQDAIEQAGAIGADETVTVRVQVEVDGQGPEAAAREARYAVLEEVAERWSAPLVLLGHTRDDQAETVLLGLTRGSGSRSLAGMRPGFSVFRRPLLDVTRAETEAACAAEGLTPWQDPHNSDDRFTRARVRHRVLPVLEDELGPGVAAALARTAAQLADDSQALDAWAGDAARDLVDDTGVALAGLRLLPTAIRTRVLRAAALAAGAPAAELAWSHVRALDALVDDPHRAAKEVRLPGHLTARARGDRLSWIRTPVGG